jgi:hypothetical protein
VCPESSLETVGTVSGFFHAASNPLQLSGASLVRLAETEAKSSGPSLDTVSSSTPRRARRRSTLSPKSDGDVGVGAGVQPKGASELTCDVAEVAFAKDVPGSISSLSPVAPGGFVGPAEWLKRLSLQSLSLVVDYNVRQHWACLCMLLCLVGRWCTVCCVAALLRCCILQYCSERQIGPFAC